MVTISPISGGEKKKRPEVERFILLMDTLDMQASVLSKKIDVPARTINNVIYENKPIGMQLMRQLNSVLGVSIDWLLGGVGAMFVATISVNDDAAKYRVVDQRIFRITTFINEFFESASEDDKAWLEMQIKYSVPHYAAWLDRRDSGE